MKAMKDHELMTIDGGRQPVYYGGGGAACPPLYRVAAKGFKAARDGDNYRKRHPHIGRMTHNRYCRVR